ncbi:hypothetical protein FRB94_011571 [Tulasnella sp. JGI-2019a]|nr:hypothetical protein FRB93_000669 [Tulasnella sp. JGI-2019a]KAG9009715.1 hypothetical protein FRB94_011571 [Tulasnella sp. JGI-2019a]KAG9034187.1 hypothetical protein FRB95_013707 [Tulasnella sp. JGI-2019a]
MRFAAVLLTLLLSSLSAMANLAIRSSSFEGGVVNYDLLAFFGAPADYIIQLLDTCHGNSSTIENNVATMNGTNTVSIPSATVPGNYQVLLAEMPTNSRLMKRANHVYAATVPFNVKAAAAVAQ